MQLHFPCRVVIDTSVLVAAARSRKGASYAIVSSIPAEEFQICLSLAVYLEWQAVLTRPENLPLGASPRDALEFLGYLANHAHLQAIYFAWRPFLNDPSDDLVLELAFAANCQYIITHNIRDFNGSQQLGITAITPHDFLKLLRRRLHERDYH